MLKTLEQTENDVTTLTEIEREWWPNIPEEEVKKYLTEVLKEGDSYKLIYRLTDGTESNCLHPTALEFLKSVTKQWGKDHPDILLAVTSLYRDEALQENFRNGDYQENASKERSSHQSGASIDFSLKSYYRKDSGKFLKVNDSENSEDQFDENHTKTFLELIKKLAEKGLCNYIVERNSVLHVCVNPNFNPEEIDINQ